MDTTTALLIVGCAGAAAWFLGNQARASDQVDTGRDQAPSGPTTITIQAPPRQEDAPVVPSSQSPFISPQESIPRDNGTGFGFTNGDGLITDDEMMIVGMTMAGAAIEGAQTVGEAFLSIYTGGMGGALL